MRNAVALRYVIVVCVSLLEHDPGVRDASEHDEAADFQLRLNVSRTQSGLTSTCILTLSRAAG